MGLKLKWDMIDAPWRATAPFFGLTLKAYSDGDWCIINPRDAASAANRRAEPATLMGAQEAAEAAAAHLLANDAGVRALLGLAEMSAEPVLDRLSCPHCTAPGATV